MNIVEININSEDKTQSKLYTLKITKTSNPDLANTNLETLAIENVLLSPNFENTNTQYTAELSNDVSKPKILAIPENENAKVDILGNENIKEGENTIIIRVTAENGITKREYNINIYKRNQEEEKSYLEEQKKQKQELEEAYKIEKTSTKNEKNIEEKEENKVFIIVGIMIIIIIIIILIIIKIIIYKKQQK